jgi:hypothetical protein
MNDIVHSQRASGGQKGADRTNIQYFSELEKLLTVNVGGAHKNRDLQAQACLPALLDNRIHQDPPSRNKTSIRHRYLGNGTVTTLFS